jgi:hypothetical protein
MGVRIAFGKGLGGLVRGVPRHNLMSQKAAVRFNSTVRCDLTKGGLFVLLSGV